jgi:uncharacterized protein
MTIGQPAKSVGASARAGGFRPKAHNGRMPQSLTDILCTGCGLCCDGTLFADVELKSSSEAAGLVILGLTVEDDDAEGGLLSQPCSALQGRRCSIYAHRPECCRTFECGLLQNVRAGAATVEQARAHITEAFTYIRRIRTLLVELGERNQRLPLNERCAHALAKDMGRVPRMSQKQTELEEAFNALDRLIQGTFFDRGARAR